MAVHEKRQETDQLERKKMALHEKRQETDPLKVTGVHTMQMINHMKLISLIK